MPVSHPNTQSLKSEYSKMVIYILFPIPIGFVPPPRRASPPSQTAQFTTQKRAATAPVLPSSPSSEDGPLFTDEPNSQIRKVIAQRLTESKTQIPHVYVTGEASIDNLLSIRSRMNSMYTCIVMTLSTPASS
jgi:pyruvate/2-oxoglutarate dehydrogenase complex dihydrolipoamide acyltransferase (E2) component